jgi:hypothetical protein
MNDPKDLYLDLMKRCLIYYMWDETSIPVEYTLDRYGAGYVERPAYKQWALKKISDFFSKKSMRLVQIVPFNLEARLNGIDWPIQAHTMIGLKRLDNLQDCIVDVIENKVPGDLIETGVWRGGATMFMRAVLKAYNVTDKTVWVADSFAGLPPPDPRYPADKDDDHYKFDHLSVSLEQVKENFSRYGLLDDQVKFLKGWFKDTLPTAPINKLSILRLDGDMYESTMDALSNLYPKLSVGGYVIVDDYCIKNCAEAVHDFRKSNNINDEMIEIDSSSVYWKRTQPLASEEQSSTEQPVMELI